MSLDIHFFSHPKEACTFITEVRSSSADLFPDIAVLVPSEVLKEKLLHELTIVDMPIFHLFDFVRHVVHSADRVPHYQSPVFDMLIRDIMEELSKRGDVFLQQLYETLGQYEQGYEGLYYAIEALLSSGIDQNSAAIIAEVLEEALQEDPDSQELKYGRAVVHITQVLYMVLQDGLGRIGKQYEDEINIGIKEASLIQAIDILQKKKYTPPKHIILYGFSDFTGIQIKLIDALIDHTQRLDLLMLNVHDLAIVEETVLDASHEIINKMLQDKILAYTNIHTSAHSRHIPQISFTSAIGYQAELRHVFHKVRQLLIEGIASEEIILVAPDWELYRPFLREESERANIPIALTLPLQFATEQTKKIENLTQLLMHPNSFSLSKICALFSFDILQKQYEETTRHKQKNSQATLVEEDDIVQANLVLLEDVQLYFQAFGLVDLQDLEEKQLVLEESWKNSTTEYVSIPALLSMQKGVKKGVDIYKANRRKLPIDFLKYINSLCLSIYTLLNTQPEFLESGNIEKFTQLVKELCRILGWAKTGAEIVKIYEVLDFIDHVHSFYPLKTYREILSLFSKKMIRFGCSILGENREKQQRILCSDIVNSSGFFAEHIFFLGLNKGVFPSVSISDPFLSEKVRQKLLGFLPTLRHKSAAYLEERHRLYSLIESSSHAHLSWIVTDEKGKACSVSPLIRRLLLAYPEEKIQEARSLYERILPDEPVPLYDRVLLAGIHGEEQTYFDAFMLFAQKKWSSLYPESTPEVRKEKITKAVHGRFQGIEELFPPLFSDANNRIGPLGGLTGLGPLSGALPEEPFEEPLPLPSVLFLDHSNYITRVEQYFSCPWRNFLERLLRVEHTPDPQKTLPQIQASIIGNIVHNSLEKLVLAQQPESASDAKEIEDLFPPHPFPVSWDESLIQQSLLQNSKEQMFLDQQLWPRASEVATNMVQSFVVVEHELEFSTPISCLGAELEGESYVLANAQGGQIGEGFQQNLNIWSSSTDEISMRVLFKADRVDLDLESGSLHLLDYKTGKIPALKKTQQERRSAILSEMEKGKKLQPAAYVSSLLHLQKRWPLLQKTKGTLLYLKPDSKVDISMRDFSIDSHDQEAIAIFGQVIWSSALAQAVGINFPRLVTKNSVHAPHTTNDWCTHCDFQRACRFSDSGFRRRLEQVCSAPAQEEVLSEEPHQDIGHRIQQWQSYLIHSIWNRGELK